MVNIEVKYKDLQRKDATELISGHVNEINTLISEIDKLNWLLRDKNQEIQNLIKDKKEQKTLEEERELALRAEIDTLRNKLEQQQDRAAADGQEQARRVNGLADKLQRDSEAYHARVTQINQNLGAVEAELAGKQNELDRTRAQQALASKEQQRVIDELGGRLDRTKRELADSEKDRAAERRQS